MTKSFKDSKNKQSASFRNTNSKVASSASPKTTANSSKTTNVSFTVYNVVVVLSLVAGISLSLYAIFVEYKRNIDSSYVAACDITESVSCSKVFTSKFGKIFSHFGLISNDSVLNQPNAVYGVLFYLMYGILYKFSYNRENIQDILLLMSTMAMILSAILSYILYVELHDICIVCYSTYVCNIALFIVSIVNSRLS